MLLTSTRPNAILTPRPGRDAPPRLFRNDADVLAETDVVDNLVKLLDADAEDAARLAGLRAIHALATRQGEILRHRVGCRACVDAVWRQLQPFERVVVPTEEEVAAAEEAGAVARGRPRTTPRQAARLARWCGAPPTP